MDVTICVCGGREYYNHVTAWRVLNQKLDELGMKPYETDKHNLIIVHGAARGADTLESEWCKAWHTGANRGHSLSDNRENPRSVIVHEIAHPADWNKYGRQAGPIRNAKMLNSLPKDAIILAFWDGVSKGTGHMIQIAQRSGRKVEIIKYYPSPMF